MRFSIIFRNLMQMWCLETFETGCHTEMDVRWCEIASLWAQTWPRPGTRAAVPAKQLISAGKKGVRGCVKVQVAQKNWCVADPHQQPTLLTVACRRGTRFANRLIETSRSWSIVKGTPLDGHGPENPHVLTVTVSHCWEGKIWTNQYTNNWYK